MPVLSSSLEGTNGATITTGTAGMDTVLVGTDATATFSNAQVAHGNTSARFTTGATAATPYVGWAAASMGSNASWWQRFNMFIPALPTVPYRIMQWGQNGVGQCMALELRNDGIIRIQNVGSALIQTVQAPVGSWFRLEQAITFSDSVGQVRTLIYPKKDGGVASQDVTTAADNNLRGIPNFARWGLVGSTTNQGPIYFDDISISTNGLIGGVLPPNQVPTLTTTSANGYFKQPIVVYADVVDPDSGPQPITYSWTIVDKPAGSAVSNTATTRAFTITPDKVGTYIARCVISDGEDSQTSLSAIEVYSPKYILVDGVPVPTRLVIL